MSTLHLCPPARHMISWQRLLQMIVRGWLKMQATCTWLLHATNACSFATNHFRGLCPTRGQRAFRLLPNLPNCHWPAFSRWNVPMLCWQNHLMAQWMDDTDGITRTIAALPCTKSTWYGSHTDKRGLACLLHYAVLHWPATDVIVGHVPELCLAKPTAIPRTMFCMQPTWVRTDAIVAHSHSHSRHRHHYHSPRVAPHSPPSRRQSPSRQAACLVNSKQ